MPCKSTQVNFGSLSVKTPLVLPGQRIGVMGGTFNPPHEGHVVVARTALKRLNLDRVWWLVTPGNPLKSHDGLAPVEERMAAARDLISDPRMIMTAFERVLGTPYTAATLQFLVTRYPTVKFVWVMGADNLATFHHWQRWRDIAAAMPFAVVDRPGWHLTPLYAPAARAFARHRVPERDASDLVNRPPPAWTFLTTRLSALSSSAIREATR